MKSALVIAGLVLGTPLAALAANANNPYGNVDHRVDAGNNTGDSQVEQLNQAQLSGAGLPPPASGDAPPYGSSGVPRPPATAFTAPGRVAPYPLVAYPAPAYAPYPYYSYPAPAYVVVPRRHYYPRPFFYPFY